LETGLSIIIPIYNEKDSIGKTVEQVAEVKKNADFPMEILLVNDASSDGTDEYLNTISEDIACVIHHANNRGYGAAIKSGMKKAKYSHIGITDADGTYPNHRFIEFFQKAQEMDCDMLVGSRVGENVKIPLIRKPVKWVLNAIANYLSGVKIPDLNSGFRIMRKSVTSEFRNILPSGFSFTTTITLAMLTNEYSVEYVPIDYYHRDGKSKIRPIYDTLNFLQLIIRTILYFNPLKIFVPLSFILFLSAPLVVFVGWLLLGVIMDVTFGIIILTAVMTLTIGMLADLIDKRTQ